MNLPEEVYVGNEKVSYIYTSSGEKLATRVGSSLTCYRGPLVYLVHPEGLTRKSTGGYVYYYMKRDHLGSTRVLCHASGNTLVADQTTGYYPFGLAHGNLNLNRYLFSGKELQDQSLGGKLLGFYDFGSRFYDPVLGRWFNVDPKLEFVSPYGYCANNPVLYIDPNGEDIVLTISKEVTVTVATRLIDLKITVPDWTGARKLFTKSITLQGDEILLAALDIVGIVDPTGIADALSASLYAQQGDLLNAMVSGVGLIPYLGDFAKMFRMKNHFKILSMAVEGGSAARGPGRGGLNLFKWGAEQTTKSTGWKVGDYMLYLPDKGTPKLNWKANYGSLRREMRLGNPIYDSYRLPDGNLIPTGGFLNAERSILQGRGWIYNPSLGAWLPPIKY